MKTNGGDLDRVYPEVGIRPLLNGKEGLVILYIHHRIDIYKEEEAYRCVFLTGIMRTVGAMKNRSAWSHTPFPFPCVCVD